MLDKMRRVVIIGRGASGKSALAVQLADVTGLPVIELDKVFWQSGLVPTPRDQWVAIQQELVKRERWIIDGDLGPYDVVDVRLRAADTVIFLDFSLVRCAWRAIRRSPERADFWRWLFAYRRQSRPFLLRAVAAHAAKADFHILRSPHGLKLFVERLARESSAETAS
jgi:adenylate kinase family enzyme